MSQAFRFPDLTLPSGRIVRVDLFTQAVDPAIAEPYFTDPVMLTVSPWLKGGEPNPVDSMAPMAGTFGLDAMTIQYSGIKIHGDLSLYEIIGSEREDLVVWNIRVYLKTQAGAWPGTPDFWGIVEQSEPAGQIESFTDHAQNKYQLSARNRLCLMERVSVANWITPYFPYNTAPYTIAPSLIRIDRYELANILHTDTATEFWRSCDTLRFVKLLEVVNTMGDAIALTLPVNVEGTFRSSWIYWAMDGAGTYVPYTADDLCIVSGIHTPSLWYWHFTFFDWQKLSGISLFNVENILQALKVLLIPLGLTALVETHGWGESYLATREVEYHSGSMYGDILRGVELKEGDHSRTGMRVVIANAGEAALGGTGGESIDCPYMSATRILAGKRWIHETGGFIDRDSDDMACIMGSLWVYDTVADEIRSVSRVTVKRDGVGAQIADPPSVTLELGSHTIALAAIAYYYNGQDPSVQPVGVYRRATKSLKFEEYGLQDGIEGLTDSTVSGALQDTGAFTGAEAVYLHRRVRNIETGLETYVTAKVSSNQLTVAADIFATGQRYMMFRDRPGDTKRMPDGNDWTVRTVSRNYGENTTEYQVERGVAE